MARDKKYSQRKQELAEKYGNECFYCVKKDVLKNLVLDHVHPKVYGGKNSIENYRLSCQRCNASKGDQTIEAWLVKNIQYVKIAKAEYFYRLKICTKLKEIIGA